MAICLVSEVLEKRVGNVLEMANQQRLQQLVDSEQLFELEC